jgi:hypothetical protein
MNFDEFRTHMTYSIRYYRSHKPEDVGLVIVRQAEFAAYKTRLETAGYIVSSTLLTPSIEALAEKTP